MGAGCGVRVRGWRAPHRVDIECGHDVVLMRVEVGLLAVGDEGRLDRLVGQALPVRLASQSCSLIAATPPMPSRVARSGSSNRLVRVKVRVRVRVRVRVGTPAHLLLLLLTNLPH